MMRLLGRQLEPGELVRLRTRARIEADDRIERDPRGNRDDERPRQPGPPFTKPFAVNAATKRRAA